MTYTRKNKGVCSKSTTVELDDKGIITKVEVTGGCDGNLKGVCALLIGTSANDAAERLNSIQCGFRSTSCPEQISLCLREALEQLRGTSATA